MRKTALITGTSRGIGRALAEKLISRGWSVIGTAVSGTNLPESDAFASHDLDLASPESIARFADGLASGGTKIDLLVNNAGICVDEFNSAVDMGKLRETFEVNLFGLIDLTERLLPLMSQGSQVLNISSTAGQLGKSLRPFSYPAYKMSKAALNMYTRTLASRYMDKGVFVASIHPGWVKTDMGGSEADFTPDEAAERICDFAESEKPMSDTGLFWFERERLDW